MVLDNIAETLRSLVYINIPALRPGTVGAYALVFVSAAVAESINAVIERINGSRDRPRVYVFVRVSPSPRLAAA
jgi:hypothetical protein